MPSQRLKSVETHVGGLLHHGADEFVGLVVLEKDEEYSCDMRDIGVVKQLSFLLPQKEHEFPQN